MHIDTDVLSQSCADYALLAHKRPDLRYLP